MPAPDKKLLIILKTVPGVTRAEIITALRRGAAQRRREADALEAEIRLRLAPAE
jgi:hypothetical protein